jgi:hypothetical protein
MKDMTCPVCGEPIACIVEINDLFFYLNDQGIVELDENQELWNSDGFLFHCTGDLTHPICPPSMFKEFEVWKNDFKEEILKIIKEKKIYDKKRGMLT